MRNLAPSPKRPAILNEPGPPAPVYVSAWSLEQRRVGIVAWVACLRRLGVRFGVRQGALSDVLDVTVPRRLLTPALYEALQANTQELYGEIADEQPPARAPERVYPAKWEVSA